MCSNGKVEAVDGGESFITAKEIMSVLD